MTGPRPPTGRAPALDELPADYHERIEDVEEDHWWHRGMRTLSAAMLGERLRRPDQRVLDAGCGTGGFLRWLVHRGSFGRAAGVDAVDEAIARARRTVPEAELRVAVLPDLPFEPASFDLVVCNDVLQHLSVDDARAALRTFRRVLDADGALLLRTSGARRVPATRAGWGAYDRATLAAELDAACFGRARITHVNLAPSLWAAGRRQAPADLVRRQGHGIPQRGPAWQGAIAAHWLELEAQLIARTPLSLPYGHTILALAVADGRTGGQRR